jgi:hypothetical protein
MRNDILRTILFPSLRNDNFVTAPYSYSSSSDETGTKFSLSRNTNETIRPSDQVAASHSEIQDNEYMRGHYKERRLPLTSCPHTANEGTRQARICSSGGRLVDHDLLHEAHRVLIQALLRVQPPVRHLESVQQAHGSARRIVSDASIIKGLLTVHSSTKFCIVI